MADSIRLMVWFVLAGAAGGTLNALLSDNAFVLPRVVPAGKNRVMRTGFLLNAIVGSVAMFVVFQLFTGVTCDHAGAPVGRSLSLLAGVIIGGLSARCMTDTADKRFLQAAVLEASGAPAAHPDTVRAMELASPHIVHVMASQLAVPARDLSYERRD